MGEMICFKDFDRTFPPDDTGFNKIGYVNSENKVIYPLRKSIAISDLGYIKTFSHQFYSMEGSISTDNVDRFFSENKLNKNLFNLGMARICMDDKKYFDSPVKLPYLDPISDKNWYKRWSDFCPEIKANDILLTTSSISMISYIIRFIDRGPWSHCGICTKNQTILEALTSGVQERSIEVYKNPKFRLGLYRFNDNYIPNPESIVDIARTQIGKPYNFHGVAKTGISKLFGFDTPSPTPNQIAIQPNLELIAIV